VPEITSCAKLATGIEAEFNFVRIRGVRGRHSRHRAGQPQAAHRQRGGPGTLAAYYKNCPFVRVIGTAPRVKDVATSNYANVSAATMARHRRHVRARQFETRGRPAAGVQWSEPSTGFDESMGLRSPAPGWT